MLAHTRTSLFFYLLVGTAAATARDAQDGSPLKSLVNTEIAFARTSSQRGMDSAFVAFMADDAVIFRPHPVNGQEWFRTHPAPPILLTWEPSFADVAAAGDLGYTTGPWMARDRADTTAAPAYGDFVTIWKKQRGDVWRVALDIGISHPAPSSAVPFSAPATGPAAPTLVRPDSALWASARSALLAKEQTAFGDSVRAVSVADFVSLADTNLRLFRPGCMPVVGVDSVRHFLLEQQGTSFRRALGCDLSRSGDLGYTYGAFRFHRQGANGEREGYYLTIWKKQGTGDWAIVLDLESVLPKHQ
jgi:ketosteroid isomerase-like protein